VLHGPLEIDDIRRRCEHVFAAPGEIAICHVLEADATIADIVGAQRRITSALRVTFGARAEGIAVFVASQRDGDDVDTYAREWGATVVVR